MVVNVQPDGLQAVKDEIRTLPGVEIHGESDAGKLVLVLESDSQNRITDIIARINDIRHVLTTALVYHQIESLDTRTGGKP